MAENASARVVRSPRSSPAAGDRRRILHAVPGLAYWSPNWRRTSETGVPGAVPVLTVVWIQSPSGSR